MLIVRSTEHVLFGRLRLSCRKFFYLGCVLLIVSTGGCASCFERFHLSMENTEAPLYVGVRFDGEVLIDGRAPEAINDADIWQMGWAVIDLPFSFLLDTVCLPSDWPNRHKDHLYYDERHSTAAERRQPLRGLAG